MKCVDYRRHEHHCPHRSKRWRWRTEDGCQGEVCDPCWWQRESPRTWLDLTMVDMLDDRGLPERPWSMGDVIAEMLS